MILTELDVVNQCLSSLGLMSINSLANSTDPMVSTARSAFKFANAAEQGAGWWFNSERVKLLPQTDGTYYVPSDTLSVSNNMNTIPNTIVIRGRKLYDTDNASFYTGTAALWVRLIRYLPFDDLPYNAQKLVAAATVEKFQANHDGDQQKEARASEEYQSAYALCMQDHTRAVRANMLNDGATGASRARVRIPFYTGRRFR